MINASHEAINFPVSPSEQRTEPIFILTESQIKKLIIEATEPLKVEIQELKNSIKVDYQDIRDLYAAIDEINHRQKTGPTDEDRIEKLKGYLRGKKDLGHRPEASFTEARAYLEVSRSQFSKLISKLDPREFVIFYHPLNYKAKMIGLARRM